MQELKGIWQSFMGPSEQKLGGATRGSPASSETIGGNLMKQDPTGSGSQSLDAYKRLAAGLNFANNVAGLGQMGMQMSQGPTPPPLTAKPVQGAAPYTPTGQMTLAELLKMQKMRGQ